MALRTGARSTVQPTVKRQNAESSAIRCRARRATSSASEPIIELDCSDRAPGGEPARHDTPSLRHNEPSLRHNERMATLRVLAVSLGVVSALAACGSSGGDSGGGGSKLVADVGSAHAEVTGHSVVATTRVRVGGVSGKHLVLQWGLIDADLGSESQQERVVHRYATTRAVVQHDETVKTSIPRGTHPYLIHFVLYAPDGTYLDSSDTPNFGG